MININDAGYSRISGTIKVLDKEEYEDVQDMVESESEYDMNNVKGIMFRDMLLLSIKDNNMSKRKTTYIKLDIDQLCDLLTYGELDNLRKNNKI